MYATTALRAKSNMCDYGDRHKYRSLVRFQPGAERGIHACSCSCCGCVRFRNSCLLVFVSVPGAEREPRNRCACLYCHRPGGGIGKFKDPAPMQADPDAITATQHAAHLSPWPRRVGPRLGKSAGADGCAVDETIRLEPCAAG